MGAGALTLGTLLTSIEARIAAQVSGETIGDYLDAPEATGQRQAHKGIRVAALSTDYDGIDDGTPGWQYATDAVEVSMLYRIDPRDQIASRTASLTFRDTVIAAVTNLAWGRSIGAVIRLASSDTEYLGEWIRHTLTLSCRRRQALG